MRKPQAPGDACRVDAAPCAAFQPGCSVSTERNQLAAPCSSGESMLIASSCECAIGPAHRPFVRPAPQGPPSRRKMSTCWCPKQGAPHLHAPWLTHQAHYNHLRSTAPTCANLGTDVSERPSLPRRRTGWRRLSMSGARRIAAQLVTFVSHSSIQLRGALTSERRLRRPSRLLAA